MELSRDVKGALPSGSVDR